MYTLQAQQLLSIDFISLPAKCPKMRQLSLASVRKGLARHAVMSAHARAHGAGRDNWNTAELVVLCKKGIGQGALFMHRFRRTADGALDRFSSAALPAVPGPLRAAV